MVIQEKFLTKNPYSRPGLKLEKVTKIALHYVGNPKSTALNNRNYFENLKDTHITHVSSHFIVGLQGEVIQCIPLDEWSYCTNQANGYSISIETCHPDATGKFNAKTEKSLAELTAFLLKKFDLTVSDIIRHYDVTGKICPKHYVENSAAYSRFKSAVAALMDETTAPQADIPPKAPSDDTVSDIKMYYVQVGAFAVRQNADKYLAEVKKRYADAFIKNYGGMNYVQVGAFGLKANAAAYLAEVKKIYKNSFIKTF